MSRKITVGAALALALLMVAASIPLTMIYAQSRQNKLIRDLPSLVGKFNALEEIQMKVNDNFFDEAADDAVNEAMVRGYIEGLKDPGSRYLSAEEYQSYMERLRGEAPELGISLIYDPDLVGLVIDQVKAGSNAAVSGLRAGDHIVKAEAAGGRVLFNLPEVAPDKAAEEIEKFYAATAVGAVATETSSISVTITYKRGGAYRPPANVMLGSSVLSLSSEMINAYAKPGDEPEKNIGYIKIYHFFQNTASQLEAAVKDLSNKGAVSFIIDVRGCNEGDLESVCKAIDLFAYVPQDTGTIVSVRRRDGSFEPHPSTASNMISYGKIAVLIDRRTSGVAELFAYDLRAFNNGKVFLVGEPTLGLSTIQEPFPLSRVGGAALLTIGTAVPYGVAEKDYATWNSEGVQPNVPTDEEVALGIIYRYSAAEQQLSGAVDVLSKPREAEE